VNWRNSHTDPPTSGQKVYYFGQNIGLWVGTYEHEPRTIKLDCDKFDLCPHIFYCDDGWGNVDACDAPYWQPYDAERESKGWRPLPPREYLTGLDI